MDEGIQEMTELIREARQAVHRLLLRRLAPVVAILAVLLGYAAYQYETAQIDALVQERAQIAVGQIVGLVKQASADQQTVDVDMLRRAVNLTVTSNEAHHWGFFPVGLISDSQGNILFEYAKPNYTGAELLSGYLLKKLKNTPYPKTVNTQRLELAGMPLVYVSLPVKNAAGEERARVDGLFAISEEAIADRQKRILRTLLATLLVVLATVSMIYPVMVRQFLKVSDLTTELLHTNLEILQVLGSAIAKRDSDTDAHNYRVTLFSVALAERVGLSDRDMRTLIKGAFLHDVGKIGIRDEILLKPGRLNEAEFKIMMTHVDHGLDILKHSTWLEDARAIVGGHQEKYDGSGYFQGVSREDIPVGARIFAIADVFDALTSKRPYKEPFSLEKSLDILREGRGTHFDPALLDQFLEIAGGLYEQLSGKDDQLPKRLLKEVVERYFQQDIGQLIES